ncbi:MAG: hypothetical protein ABFD89_16845 [Bryobacteraceae bacterium]
MTLETSSRHVRARRRENVVLDLRMAGKTYRRIATELGISPAGAFKVLDRALARLRQQTSEVAERLLQIELERLDALQLAQWDKATDGDLRAVDAVLRIMERRARLLGLDAPVENRLDVDFPRGDIDAEIEQLLCKVASGEMVPGCVAKARAKSQLPPAGQKAKDS